jgi:hypothetical protein
MACSVLALASATKAGETVTYSYDGRGRLKATATTGTVNSGAVTTIGYDPAGNRSTYQVTGIVPPAPPAPPAFSVSAGSANEGSPIIFTIARSNAKAGTYSVNYATSNGGAAAYSDYYPASGTLTFTTQASQTVSVATIKDNSAEPAETVLMTLSNPTGGATLQTAQANGTVNASAANTPPTTVTDTVSIARCVAGSFNVVANDTDAEGDIPLTVTAISGGAVQLGYASVGTGGTVAWAKAPTTGLYPMTYTVKDSRDSSSTGSLHVTVTGSGSGACP